MLILGSLRKLTGGRVKIPFYHRAPLSLMTGTEVSLCYVPKSASRSAEPLPEIIVSTIPYEAWDNCWRLSAAFRDRAGVVHQLLDILASLGMNIHVHESGSVDMREVHEMEIVFDAKRFFASSGKLRTQDQEIQRLQTMLRCLFIDDLDLTENGPRLSIRRMKGLSRVSQAAMKSVYRTVPLHVKAGIDEKSIILPEDVVVALKEDGCLFTEDEPRMMLVCDTRDRLLRILFPMPAHQLLHARVSHESIAGALAGITKAIKEDFDILNCLTRPMSNGRNEFDLLISPLPKGRPNKRRSEGQMKREFERVLNAAPYLKPLRIAPTYPQSIGKRDVIEKPQSGGVLKYKYEPETGHLIKDVNNIIRSKIKRLERMVATPEYDKALSVRLAYLRKHAFEFSEKRSLKIFVSFNFQQNDKLALLRAQCKRHNIEIVTGHNPSGKPLFRDVIKDRISDCPVFLGVWTGTGRKISPWFLWELGVAHAYGKTVQLVLDSRIEPELWQRIIPEMHHFVFHARSNSEEGFNGTMKSCIDGVLKYFRDRGE